MAVVGISLLLLLIIQFVAARSLLVRGYSSLESDKTYIQIKNAQRMIALQGQQLEGLTKNWAHWDDSYDYMATHKQAYIDSNYTNAVFSNLKINAIFLTNNNGEIVYQSGYDFVNDKPWAIPSKLNLAVSKNGIFIRPTKTGSITGLLWTDNGLMMVSAMDILPTIPQGSRRGVLIMMRLIDTLLIKQLEAIVGAKISITHMYGNAKIPENIRQAAKQINSKNSWVMQALNKDEVAGYTWLHEADAANTLMLRTISDRKIFELWQNSSNFILWSTGGIALLLFILSWIFNKLVIARLTKLSNSVSFINEVASTSTRVPTFVGNDELAKLAQRINGMLISLDEQQKALKDSEFRWKFAIEGSGDGVWDWNPQTDEAHYSMLWKSMLGYSEEDILPTNDEWASRVHPDDQSHVKATMQAYLDGKTDFYVAEYRLRCKSNQYKWILGRGMIVNHSEDGKPLRMIGTHTDITERKQAESELKIAATAFESQEGIIVTDVNNIILRVNSAFTKITGYTAADAIGQTPFLISSDQHDEESFLVMWNSIKNQGVWEGDIWNRRKNADVYPGHLTITAVKDDNNIVINYVTTLTDITLRKAAEEEIQRLAFYDALTGLPNRRLLLDRLKQAAIYSVRSGQGGAILFLDLDHFKTLNDTLGHDIGDLLLQQVSLRLESCVREGDTVARLGGDEFVIMLENLSEQAVEAAAQAEDVGEKILVALNQPYQLSIHEYKSTPSIGAAMINRQNYLPEELLKQADIAMYQAKKAGRNAIRFFDPQMQANINARVNMERELHLALEKQQFHLYYQAQVDHLGCCIGVEALIRWIHPDRGMVSPQQFVSLAEDAGLILPIGIWVLNTACAQIKAWQLDLVTSNLTLSINVSAKQFHQVDFVAQVQSAVLRHGINPLKLKLELTESMLLDNVEVTISTMQALKAIGIRCSLDDFGTGYSSLQYLKQLPIYQLKIDQTFVCDIAKDNSDLAIVRTIVAMAKTLNLDVIAEGVETKAQRQLLLNIGCKHYQGYLFAKPLPIAQFNALLNTALITS